MDWDNVGYTNGWSDGKKEAYEEIRHDLLTLIMSKKELVKTNDGLEIFGTIREKFIKELIEKYKTK